MNLTERIRRLAKCLPYCCNSSVNRAPNTWKPGLIWLDALEIDFCKVLLLK